MPNEHLAELRILITQVEQTEDETQRAAALAELQRVGATALREAVSRARDRGVPWRTLAGELQVAVTTLHHQFKASRVTPPRDDQPRRVLPTPSMDQFVGRQQELAELGGLLSSSRLVTLSGTGGIGKTRLAGEFVRRSSTEYDAVWWVELAPLADDRPVEAAITATLAGPPEVMIGTGTALLVLDNCEHLIDACAQLVPRLLTASGGLRVLTTSREQLGVPGERVFPVAPLPVDPAVRLFTERARAVVHDFELTDELTDVVADLCLRLDGLPLAIELAAQQVAVLPPAELVTCLDERLTLLAGGPRTAPARHQSLSSAIEWSYDLLSATEQAMFRRLTIFPDSFERQDAAAVCADLSLSSGTLWTVLGALVDKSLIVADGERLRVLESLRQFGHTQLVHCAEWASTVDLFVERLAWFSYRQPPPNGMTREQRWLKRNQHRYNLEYAVTLAEPTDDERYAQLVAGLVMARAANLSRQGSRELLQGALARQQSAPGRVILAVELCNTLVGIGEFAAAREAGEQAVAVAREHDEPLLAHFARYTLALACSRLSDHERLHVLLPQLVQGARRIGEPHLLAESLTHIVWYHLRHGRLTEADDAVTEALSIIDESSPHPSMADVLNLAGLIALCREDADRATAHFTITLTLSCVNGQVDALDHLGLVAASTGRPDRALRLLTAATTAREKGCLVRNPWLAEACSIAARTARAQLPPATADALLADGAELTVDQAIALALDDTATSPVLTPREWEVASLVADGCTNREIARRQGVSTRTVVTDLERIRAKLDLPTRTHVAAWATRSRIEWPSA